MMCLILSRKKAACAFGVGEACGVDGEAPAAVRASAVRVAATRGAPLLIGTTTVCGTTTVWMIGCCGEVAHAVTKAITSSMILKRLSVFIFIPFAIAAMTAASCSRINGNPTQIDYALTRQCRAGSACYSIECQRLLVEERRVGFCAAAPTHSAPGYVQNIAIFRGNPLEDREKTSSDIRTTRALT